MKSHEKIQQVFNSTDHVNNYEMKAHESNWTGPDIVFGLSYRHIQPQETILDIGIGTGLSSILFHKAGLQIYGVDNSAKMLKACESKQVTVDLQQHDLLKPPYPFPDKSINHAVSAGVFHIFPDLSPVFTEVARIVKPGGIFVFTVMDYRLGEPAQITVESKTFPGQTFTKYRFNENDIKQLLMACGFSNLKSVEFTMNHHNERVRSCAYLTRKNAE